MDINKINEIIDEEIEFAKQVNPQMAMGMSQIKKVLNENLKEDLLITPLGNFKPVINDNNDFPKIDIIEVNQNGEDVGLVSSVEYNPIHDSISTYGYEAQTDSSHEVEFVNKTIYNINI